MTLAAQEMGEDAMLVYSREASPEARYLGKYEVVFALPPSGPGPSLSAPVSGASPSEPPPVPDLPPTARIAEALSGFQSNFADVMDRLDHLSFALRRQDRLNFSNAPSQASGVRLEDWREDLQQAWTALLRADVPEALADELIEAIAPHLEAPGENDAKPRWRTPMRMAMESRLTTDPVLGADAAASRVVALIGPPGSGKTSTLVKLAARYGLSSRRPAHLLSFDTCRIAGAEQLRTYAGILGIGFQAVETSGAMLQALEEHRNKELILVDTAGLSDKDIEAAEELDRMFQFRPDIDVHLTLSASMKSADLSRVVDRFARFHPRKLLFTRLDETSSFGSIWAEPVKRSLPVSFLCDGQQIPEDLHPASPNAIVDLLIGRPTCLAEEDRSAAAA